MTQLQPPPQETPETALHHGRLGVLGIVFFVVAAAAPLVGMTGAVPVAIVLGNGAAAPGAYVVVGLVLLLFSVGYAAMATKVTNTGAFFAFVGRGLGIIPGVGSAFTSLVAYIAIQLAIYGFFGALVSSEMNDKFGIDQPWWFWTLISWALVTGLSALSVDIGAKLLGVLMTLELLSLLVTAFAVLFSGDKPEGIDLAASFAPSNIFAGGLASTAGIALAFAFASYIGFEATAIYGEESKDPHRTVPRATYLAVIAITVIFGFTAFAIVTGLGSSTVIDRTVELSTVDGTPLANPAAVLFGVADQYVGSWMVDVMSWLVISSLFAGLLAFQNSAARYFFSMGRAGVLPTSLDRVNGRGAPVGGTVATSVITLARDPDLLDRRQGPGPEPLLLVLRPRRAGDRLRGDPGVRRRDRVLLAAPGRGLDLHLDRRAAGLDPRPRRRPVAARLALRAAGGHRQGGRRPDRRAVGPEHDRLDARARCRS